MTQSYIDTMILQAFVNFSQAMSVGGVGFRRKEAIAHAKNVCRKLRKMAQGDPNEKYVLWKVSELEAHIWYEAQEIEEQQRRENLAVKNSLIDQFNALIGAKRPRFDNLVDIHSKMLKLDTRTANELAASIEQRSRNVSLEISRLLDNALAGGEMSRARNELEYCRRYQGYLTTSMYKLNALETKLQYKANVTNYQDFINEDAEEARQYLLRNQLELASGEIAKIERNINRLREKIGDGKLSSYEQALDELKREFERKEIVFVNKNLQILMKEGVEAAFDYMESALRMHGVSLERIGEVYDEIMNVALQEQEQEDSEISKELEKVGSAAEENAIIIGDLSAAAKRKAQARADSIKAEEEKRQRAYYRKNRRKIRRAERRKARKQRKLAKIRARQEKKAAKRKVREEKALAEARKREAHEREAEEKRRAPARKQRDQHADNQASRTFVEESDMAYAPAPAEAYNVEIEKTAKPSRQDAHASSSAYAYDDDLGTSEDISENESKAQEYIMRIYGLLEEEKIGEAYNRFMQFRSPLKKFSDPEAFKMLEVSVFQAYNYHRNAR
ncbi:MAG: hypothetical protein GF398_16285 [Chitinivibrionales bacterium]|nr:hypothetical protein [Chitinivibrionales bacterium]